MERERDLEMLTDEISSSTCVTRASERASKESQFPHFFFLIEIPEVSEGSWECTTREGRRFICLFSRHSNPGRHGDLSLHREEREESLFGDIACAGGQGMPFLSIQPQSRAINTLGAPQSINAA